MVELIGGESYLVRLTVTNQSTKAGQPVEATLGVGILSVVNSAVLIPEKIISEYFAPGETRSFDYPMDVPLGYGGQSGNVFARIQDPTGLVIAQATENVVIEVSPAIDVGPITWVQGETMPEFSPGEIGHALFTMRNPTLKAFNYYVQMYIGTDMVGSFSVDIDAGESKNISLGVTMPSVVGTYPVYIGVWVEGWPLTIPLLQRGEVVIALPPPVVEINSFHYVYQAAYTWALIGSMIHGRDITHIGFMFTNIEAVNIPGVSLKFRVIDGGTHELSPPRDAYNIAIPQPFTLAPGFMQVWYESGPRNWGYPSSAEAIAEVYIDDELVVSSYMPFTISYN